MHPLPSALMHWLLTAFSRQKCSLALIGCKADKTTLPGNNGKSSAHGLASPLTSLVLPTKYLPCKSLLDVSAMASWQHIASQLENAWSRPICAQLHRSMPVWEPKTPE
eukprot:10059506-Ditylum_brightwellii.AAC.1